MNSLTDQQLLRDYTERRAEAAFAELVRRHVDYIYSAALRMVRDAHLAEDVTQGVFVALAQNAPQLTDRPVLSGWLHRTVQNIAAQTVRSDVRRHAREQEAAAMNELLSAEPEAVWEHIAPQLDAALGELSEPDRDALLLRYFERKSAREMGELLGTSEDAAQKRVNRAVERLRDYFSKRNITIGASGLAVAVSANAVQAAPVGLAATISAASILAGTAVSTSTVIAATKIIAMTTLQKTLVATALTAAIGTGIYEAHQNLKLRDQVQALQQQQAEQQTELYRLRTDSQQLAKAKVDMDELERLRSGQVELLRLRGEVARLRQTQRDSTASRMPSNPGQEPLDESFQWSSEQLKNAGRATPLNAVQTYLWAGVCQNAEEMNRALIPDAADPPPDEAVRQFVTANTGTPTEPYLLTNIVYQVSSQKEISPDEIQMELAFDLKSKGISVHKKLTMRNVGGEWRLVIFNTPNPALHVDADLSKPE